MSLSFLDLLDIQWRSRLRAFNHLSHNLLQQDLCNPGRPFPVKSDRRNQGLFDVGPLNPCRVFPGTPLQVAMLPRQERSLTIHEQMISCFQGC